MILEEHPLLDAEIFHASFAAPLGELPASPGIASMLRLDGGEGGGARITRSEEVRGAVRDLLRHGGYKPTGRGKPASEYLLRAAEEGMLQSINRAVDVCNLVSLHSGLPISVVDLDRTTNPLRIAVVPMESPMSYIFNASGQEIDVRGLLSLHDAEGPCANAVKDAQRTKTSGATRRVLYVIWGTKALPGAARAAGDWARALLGSDGAQITLPGNP